MVIERVQIEGGMVGQVYIGSQRSFLCRRVDITILDLGKIAEAFSITPRSAVATHSC
jgi:hypothetical protein